MPTLYQVDSFASKPFTGNPAAVCVLPEAAKEAWMQDVAAEMNLAETAFVFPVGEEFNLRWFTPAVEVDLCGHATLATAHVLWESGRVQAGKPCVFHSKSGKLVAEQFGDKIQLDFPAAPPTETEAPDGMIEALDVEPVFVGTSDFDFLVEIESTDQLKSLQPDMRGLKSLKSRGVIVTARDNSGQFDFISRFFGPAVGIDEDPVTGSAHCTLGPFWMSKLNKSTLDAWQASPRGGGMTVTVEGDRVKLLGSAVTVLRGEWIADCTSLLPEGTTYKT